MPPSTAPEPAPEDPAASGPAPDGPAADAPPDAPVLVVNAGSSSLKVQLLPDRLPVLVERIGGDTRVRAPFAPDAESGPLERHDDALAFVLELLRTQAPARAASIVAVGHRVVHGGDRFSAPAVVDDGVEAAIEELAVLAPLHNPVNLQGIRAARRALPSVPHVAVFDTAFHASMPRRAYLYGLPPDLARRLDLRVYGFHGTSHDYVSRRLAVRIGRPREELRLVTLHLGNGASAAAVQGGRSVDTTMGFTPLDGLLMGTRSGSLDPAVVLRLLRSGMDVDEVDRLLNKGSGLQGMSGVSNDMRDLRAAAAEGNDDARAALEVFAYRARRCIGAYAAAMGGLDGVAFTGGIGENDVDARAEILEGLGFLGLELDPRANAEAGGRGEVRVTRPGRAEAWVIPTDEEGAIAAAARAAAGGAAEGAA